MENENDVSVSTESVAETPSSTENTPVEQVESTTINSTDPVTTSNVEVTNDTVENSTSNEPKTEPNHIEKTDNTESNQDIEQEKVSKQAEVNKDTKESQENTPNNESEEVDNEKVEPQQENYKEEFSDYGDLSPEQLKQLHELIEEENSKPLNITQSNLNDIIKKRISREQGRLCRRYNVKSLNELDNMVGRANSYFDLQIENADLSQQLKEAQQEIKQYRENELFNNLKINPDRFDDVRTYFKGKDLDLTKESLTQYLKSHPEWKKIEKNYVEENPRVTLRSLGNPPSEALKKQTDRERILSKYFGMKED